MLKSVVIDNLVPEHKRQILFSTQIADDNVSEESESKFIQSSEISALTSRVENLEAVLRKLIEYMTHVPKAKMGKD